jgi:hypothetical protein
LVIGDVRGEEDLDGWRPGLDDLDQGGHFGDVGISAPGVEAYKR